MVRFKVPVRSETPMETWEALDRVGVPTLGPTYTHWVESEESGTVSPPMTAVLDADSAETALAHVRQAVGEACELGAAEPLDTT
jgi:hypothetical protein